MFADLVLKNGKIVTMDPMGREFSAAAVLNGRIVKLGEDVKDLVGPATHAIDLRGRVVLPGFIDTHAHPATFGVSLAFEVNCRHSKSIEEIKEGIRKKAQQTPSGSWILGVGYNQFQLVEQRHPTRKDLDNVTSSHPVVVRRVCGHMCVANSKALEIAGINSDSQVSGGIIDKDPSTKEPTGLLREKAQNLVLDRIPSYAISEIKEGLRQCFRKLVEWGITTVHDAGILHLQVSDAIQAYQELLSEKQLPVRVGLIIPHESLGKDLQSALSDVGVRSDFGDNWLKIVGMKYIADGSIGSHTAALRDPYLKESENRGVEVMSQEALNKRVAQADATGLRACIHAIGDRGIDMAIQAIELAQKNRAKPYLKHRIEHCGVCWPSQMKKIKELDIVVSSSTSFMFKMAEDSAWKEGLGAERMRRLYPHKELIEHGIVTAGNSDLGPAENAYPMIGIYTEVMRTCAPEQRISLVDAIRSYTIDAAKAGNDDAERGTLEVGKLADMIVLSKDPFSVPAEDLLDIKVDFTIVDGTIMYERRDAAHA